jgi:hypothetical protein
MLDNTYRKYNNPLSLRKLKPLSPVGLSTSIVTLHIALMFAHRCRYVPHVTSYQHTRTFISCAKATHDKITSLRLNINTNASCFTFFVKPLISFVLNDQAVNAAVALWLCLGEALTESLPAHRIWGLKNWTKTRTKLKGRPVSLIIQVLNNNRFWK